MKSGFSFLPSPNEYRREATRHSHLACNRIYRPLARPFPTVATWMVYCHGRSFHRRYPRKEHPILCRSAQLVCHYRYSTGAQLHLLHSHIPSVLLHWLRHAFGVVVVRKIQTHQASQMRYCLTISLLTLLLFKAEAQQTHEADSVMQVVLGALTTDEHQVTGSVDDHLTAGTWEALAYWNMNDPKDVEYLQEAVGDQYLFQDGKFRIDFIDPNNPRQIGSTFEGYYQRKGNFLELYKSEGNPVFKIELWYLDSRYMVIEIDGLRIFLTQEKSYYLTD